LDAATFFLVVVVWFFSVHLPFLSSDDRWLTLTCLCLTPVHASDCRWMVARIEDVHPGFISTLVQRSGGWVVVAVLVVMC
jgi:hypothetical protein